MVQRVPYSWSVAGRPWNVPEGFGILGRASGGACEAAASSTPISSLSDPLPAPPPKAVQKA
eukprot:7439862-Alexandrium_andersonii.AAC.1